MKILLCEDEASIRAFLKINFERNGFTVIEAGTGEDALRLTELERPQVAILDVMLPGIDGFEVCRRIRSSHPEIGIIMLTAKGQDMDKIEGLGRGRGETIQSNRVHSTDQSAHPETGGRQEHQRG